MTGAQAVPLPKICANLICRDSSKTIEACIRSLEGINFLNITDTGSKDNTKRIIERVCRELKIPYQITDYVWNDHFADARNFNFSHSPSWAEWDFWCDSDDVVEDIEKAKEMLSKLPQDVGGLWLPYFYAFDEFGNATTVFIRERFLRKSVGWKWQSRVHETVAPLTPTKFVKDQAIIIKHNHTGQFSRAERNFKLLFKMLEEEPENKRVWLYIGHQHFAQQDYLDAAKWYLKFNQAPDALPIEKYQALTYASKALREMRDFQQSVSCSLMAMELYPHWADAYIELACSYLGINQPQKSIFWGEASKDKQMPEEIIFINPLDYTFNISVTLFNAYLMMGNIDKALEEARKAYQVRPIKELDNQFQLILEAKNREETERGLKALANSLLKAGERTKLQKILEVLPWWLKELPQSNEFVNNIKSKGIVPFDEPTKVDGNVLIAGTDFFSKEHKGYYEKVVCNCLEKVTEELPSALYKLEQYGDRVELLLDHTQPHNRMITQKDLEQVLPTNHREIEQLYTDVDKTTCHWKHSLPVANGLAIKLFSKFGVEKWSPLTMKREGIGGSELATIRMAEELVKQGNRVIVYGPINGVWNGVVYREDVTLTPCDVFITSRVPDVLDYDLNTKKKYLWIHDVSCWNRLTPERAEKLDGIIVLSKWHKNYIQKVYPWLKEAKVIDLVNWDYTYDDFVPEEDFVVSPEAKISKVPNIYILPDGMDYSRFDGLKEHREPYSFIWSSSPDRGLLEVLEMWPLIKEAMPKATLNIYYGWNYFDSTLNIPSQWELNSKLMSKLKQDGVKWCGRVNQEELAKAMCRSEMWLYPPHPFRETCCITAMELQAAGVLCFYRKNGALGETIANRGIPIELNAKPEDIVKLIKDTMDNKTIVSSLRVEMKKWVKEQGWLDRANKLLYGIINE